MNAPLLELQQVTRFYGGRGSRKPGVAAVRDVDLQIAAGEVVGLVGESGSGKTTLGRVAAGSLAPSQGRRLWKGRDAATFDAAQRRALRLAIQMVFQDAQASLNPRLPVGAAVGEAPALHGLTGQVPVERYVADFLPRVGLDGSLAARYPHELSGGQRSRINIARALAVRPELLIADEPVAALDASVRAQLVELLAALSRDSALSILLISHDLGVVRVLARRVAIMYLGRLVEVAPVENFFAGPHHPYSQALLADVPRLDVRHKVYRPLTGDAPPPWAPPEGCPFHPRCPRAFARCRVERPALRELSPDHRSACHLPPASPGAD